MKKDAKTKKKPSGEKWFPKVREVFLNSPVRWYDWLILALFALFCFLVYAMSDLYHTAACSYGYLDGHVLDFYDYLAANGVSSDGSLGIHASYMPTAYVLFALWNIPMKLFRIVPHATMQLGYIAVMWAKLLPCLVLLASGYLIYLVSKELGMNRRKALLVVYAFLSCPVILYGQAVIGQYESFFIFFVLLGFLYYLKKKDIGFIAAFGIAVTFKYTALIIFIPLVLLREKNVLKIIGMTVLTFVPFALEYLLYMHSEAFRMYAFGIGSSGDNPTGYITNAVLFTGFTFGGNLNFVIYLTVIAFALVCGWAYFTECRNREEEGRFAIFFAGLALTLLFTFSKWHSHWLMPVFVFYTLSAFLHRKTGVFMVLDLLFGVLFIMFCTCQFEGAHDEAMINNGLFKFLLPDKIVSPAFSLTEYYRSIDMSMELTFLTAIMLVNAVFKHPKFLAEDPDLTNKSDMHWIRARFILPLLLLFIPSVLLVRNTLNQKPAVYDEDRRGIFVSMKEEMSIAQPFVAEGETLKKLVFPVSRGALYDTPVMEVLLKNADDEVLYSEEVDIGNYFEGQLVRLKPDKVTLVPGEAYYVEFNMKEVSEDSTFCLLAFDQGDYPDAVKKGKNLPYHMNLRIYQ
ncbi:MAG: DUF2029 domain-containing protein [Lachnospiraceae bacterium]|nr:DUF2029 domain-containing protein [Lachnospiraceae bacterium]